MQGQSERAAPGSLLYLFAFLSGAAALMYEVAWGKILALTFGRTTVAASAVIGGFMAGMGIGAWLYHRVQGDRFHALRLYALLEVGIAVTTALLTLTFEVFPDLFARLSAVLPGGLFMQLFRVAVVVSVLLVPAALMGATYPALCTVLIRSREGAARHLGPLYGLNTIGGAAGALLAGFVLLEWLGLRGSVAVANALNLAIGAGALWLGRSVAAGPTALKALDEHEAVFETTLPRRLTGLVLLGSGFATLAYEIVWFRALRYLFGNSTYAFTIMLVVFLVGLGLGALLCRERPPGRGRAPEVSLAHCQLGIAVLAMLAITVVAFVLANHQIESAVSIFSGTVHNLPWWQRLALDGGVALLVMLPATLLMGFSFPLATRLFLGDVRRLGERVGGATLLANLGSIMGAVVAALVILPQLGTISGTRAIAGLNLLLGCAVLARQPGAGRSLALAGGALALLLATSLFLPARLPFRVSESIASQSMDLLFEEEGDLATVQVWAARAHPERRAMTVDGTAIGESRGLRRAIYGKQILLAHLPMSLDPDASATLNIGLGSASTLDTLAGYPDVQFLEAVEISGAVARGSLLFEESRVLSDPRVALTVEDVSHFLLQDGRRYDLIISDGKLGADFSGNAMMLCRDFYDHAARRLADDGLFIQWIPLTHRPEDFATVLRTFLASFPEVEVFFEDPGALLAVGSSTPLRGRAGSGAPLSARAREDLEPLEIPSSEALLSRWLAGGDALRAAVGPGRISTWDHSVFEYSIYRSTPEQRRRAIGDNLEFLLRASHGEEPNPFLPPDTPFAESTPLLRTARWHASHGRVAQAVAFAEQAATANPADPRAASMQQEMRRRRERRLERQLERQSAAAPSP